MFRARRRKRPTPLDRERNLRRRRWAALVVIAAIAAVVLALTLAVSSGSRSRTTHVLKTTTTPSSTATKPVQRKESKPARAQRKLEAAATRAVSRFAEIGLPVYCGSLRKKVVALTFDDGPGPYTRASILHVLHKRHARATFFLVGRRIQEYPAVPKQEAEVGAVGDHTWNHALLTGLDDNAMKSEVEDAQTAIADATGYPVTLFRPPYGARDAAVDREVNSLGMVETMWSLDSLDWQGGSGKELVARVVRELRPGSIVLMHDIHPDTIAAIWKLVPELHHLGYRLVTVPELLAIDPPSEGQLERGLAGCAGAQASRGAG